MTYIKHCFLILLPLFLLTSCIPDEDDLNASDWQPEIAVPLFEATFELEDILAQFDNTDVITVDSNRLIHIVYEGEVFSLAAEELFTFPRLAGPIGDSTGSLSTVFPGFGSIQQIDIKSGNVRIGASTTDTGMVRMLVQMPDLTFNGVPLTFDTTFEAGTIVIKHFDLAGYSLRATNFEVGYQYTSTQVSTGNPVRLTGGIDFQDVAYSYIEGLLDPITSTTPIDTLRIDLFNNRESAVLKFEDFDLGLTFVNSFGLPVRGEVLQLDALTNQGNTLPITSSAVAGGVDFNYPSLSEVGSTKETLVSINDANSNFGAAITEGPNRIAYQMEGTSLPMTDVGFLTDSSRFGLDMRLDLPLFLTADKFFADQLRDFTIDDWGPIDKLEEASLRIQTENGYPVTLNMQVYLIDGAGARIDSVFDGFRQLLAAAEVDGNARSTAPAILNFDVEFSAAKIENLRRTEKLLVHLDAETLNNSMTPVKIFDDYIFTLKMGLRAKFNP